MGLSNAHITLLQRIADGQPGADEWVIAAPGLDARTAGPLVKLGLAREAQAGSRAELSADAGRPVLWAVQLTDDGWDVLVYTTNRATALPIEPPEPGLQKVALRRSDLDVLKRFVAVGGQLRGIPAQGLDLKVETAQFHPPSNRWILYVDGAQMESMARAFFLERHSGSAAPANRFARVYGVIYPPQEFLFAPAAQHDRAH